MVVGGAEAIGPWVYFKNKPCTKHLALTSPFVIQRNSALWHNDAEEKQPDYLKLCF